MKVGTYTGTGASQSIAGLDFSPDIVFVLGNNSDEPVHKVSAVTPAANAFTFSGGASTNYITALGADGFTVGTDTRVNRAGDLYHYVAWNEIPGKIDVGTYTGNGADNRNIPGVGFQPDFVMVQTNGGLPTVAHSTAMGPSIDISHFFNATVNQANQIQALQPDGFQVGSAPESNGTGSDFHVRRLGACGADRGPHGQHERPPNGGQASSSSGAPGTKSTTWASTSTAGAKTSRVRLTTSLLAGSGLLRSPGSGPAPVTRTAGATRPLTPGPPTSSTGWKKSISTATRTWHGPVRPEMQRRADDRAPHARHGAALGQQGAQRSPRHRPRRPRHGDRCPNRSPRRLPVRPRRRSTAPARRSSRPGGVAPLASADGTSGQWSIASQRRRENRRRVDAGGTA